VDGEPAHSQVPVPVQDTDAGARLQKLPSPEGPAEDSVGEGSEGDREGEGLIQRSGTSSPMQGVLDFLSTTEVGRLVLAPAKKTKRRSRNSRSGEKEKRSWRSGGGFPLSFLVFPLSLLFLSFVISLVRPSTFGRPWAEATYNVPSAD